MDCPTSNINYQIMDASIYQSILDRISLGRILEIRGIEDIGIGKVYYISTTKGQLAILEYAYTTDEMASDKDKYVSLAKDILKNADIISIPYFHKENKNPIYLIHKNNKYYSVFTNSIIKNTRR